MSSQRKQKLTPTKSKETTNASIQKGERIVVIIINGIKKTTLPPLAKATGERTSHRRRERGLDRAKTPSKAALFGGDERGFADGFALVSSFVIISKKRNHSTNRRKHL